MSAVAALPEGGRFGRFEIRLDERRLRADGQPVGLGSRAFDLLAALSMRRDRVVPKEELIALVWPGLVVEDNNLQAQISALRKVLGASAIATVPGRGYQFTLASGAPSAREATPAIAAAEGAMRERAAPIDAPRASRLLVADDNKVNRLLLCRSLTLMGHDVVSADNGRSALDMLHAEPFDLLLLDLEMPELDGFGLLEQRAADPALRELPVIVTSSIEGVGPVARCIELGADDYLHKPVNPLLLKARVDMSLARKHGRDRERALLARLARDQPDTRAAATPHRVEATVLVARLRVADPPAVGSAQETLELLGAWATLMLDAIEGHAGVPAQLSGDGITAVFCTTDGLAPPTDAAWRAARAAQEMQALVALFDAERTRAGAAPVVLGIGIASGLVVTGQVGTPRRAAFVCVGEAVRRAAQLEASAGEPGQGGVLMDEATHAAVAGRLPAGDLQPAGPSNAPIAAPAYSLSASSATAD